MERKNKKSEEPNEIYRWRKIGGGGCRLVIKGSKKIIKPNQVFEATEEEVPEAFRDVIIKIDAKAIQEYKEILGSLPTFEAKEREDEEGVWDVFNGKGKKLNEKGLTKEKADKFIETLTE